MAGGLATIKPVFRFLGAPADVIPLIQEYMVIWYIGVMTVVIPMIGNSAIRATGDTKTPSMVMLVAVVANIILDPILIFGFGPIPRLGLAGAALATVIARAITFFFALWVLSKRERMLTFAIPKFRDVANSWKQILYIGLPNAGTGIIAPIASGIITRLIAVFGVASVAAFGVANRVQMFALLLVMALSTVVSLFVGQNWGAKKYDRAQLSIRYTQRFVLIWGLIAVVTLAFFGGSIATLFNSDPTVISAARLYFWIVPIGYGLYGVLRISTAVLSVLRKPFLSALLTLIQTFAIHIPLAFLGAELLGLPGIFGAGAISFIIAGCGAYIVLKKVIADSMDYDFLQRVVQLESIAGHPSSLGYWLTRLQLHARHYLDKVLSEYYLERHTLAFFLALHHKDGQNSQELAERMQVNTAVVSKAVKRLTDLGYLRKKNGNVKGFMLTEAAREIAPDVKRILESWSGMLSRGFTEEQRQTSLSLLKKMNDNVLEALS